jgi:hypothetical protein
VRNHFVACWKVQKRRESSEYARIGTDDELLGTVDDQVLRALGDVHLYIGRDGNIITFQRKPGTSISETRRAIKHNVTNQSM